MALRVTSILLVVVVASIGPSFLAAPDVPTDIEQPGTQPLEVGPFDSNCDSCHFSDRTDADLQHLPSNGWMGGMMANALRDPLFWATVAVAEQDFLPNAEPALRGGAGDLCLRCHTPNGWLGGRSTPTDGSELAGDDERGVECEFCHLLVDPDRPVNVAGTTEEQNAPYEAFDPDTGEAYYGSGEYVINSGGTRLGPYDDAAANHAFLPSPFHRSGDFCGTCHDVSNPAVGDLAHNNGAQVPLEGGFSGIPGAPVEGKAAFNNPPFAYGMVERTYSEWKASALDDLPVRQFPDGTARTYTCQTCHMPPVSGKGCNKRHAPVRSDLPWHDQTGSGYWMPDAIVHQLDNGRLLLGSLSAAQRAALIDGKDRARAMLSSAASLDAVQSGAELVVRVTNLTAHKLISGYPEGRRMWLNVVWRDAAGTILEEDGAYGPVGRELTDLDGVTHAVQSIVDLHETTIYQAKPGMDQAWAGQLLDLGYDPALPLTYDRLTDEVIETLGDLAAEEPEQAYPTFHFVLNNVMTADNRIPPYGFDYNEARTRNALPVPEAQYGAPEPGGVYDYRSEVGFGIPWGAATADVTLFYQQTSWEYIQFLWLANDELGPFLGQEGINMLDAWLATGMSEPFPLATARATLGAVSGVPGEASAQDVPLELMHAALDLASGVIDVTYTPACDATSHTIYYGDLATVGAYGYSGAACFLGTSGSASFDPGSGSVFFLVVAEDGVNEGSYGRDSHGVERPEDLNTPTCDRPQDLDGVICE